MTVSLDGGAVSPQQQAVDELVDRIADRWGVEDRGGGKRVWFELAVPAFADADARGGVGGP
jgi:hypothetical protein